MFLFNCVHIAVHGEKSLIYKILLNVNVVMFFRSALFSVSVNSPYLRSKEVYMNFLSIQSTFAIIFG